MATVGDLVDTIHLIKKIINAIETAQKLKDDCLDFKEYLCCISKHLEQLQGMPLSDTTVETLRRVEDVLVKAYHVIDSSQNHNFVYLMLNSTRILKQIKEAHNMVVNYMGLIPIMQLNETFRLFPERTIILREPQESTPNGTNAVSNSGCSMAQGVCSSQIALSNQAEFKVDLRSFKFKELRTATNDFKHDQLIGEGGFSSVYKGLIKDNSGHGTLDVAIKRARHHHSKEDTTTRFKHYPTRWGRLSQHDTELKYLQRISHPNVIKLLGYCDKIDKREWIRFHRKEANIYLLVFEYMTNGSLFSHLFSDKQEPLSWAQRIKITNGSARALAHLHELQIIHRDMKSANILLDLDFNSKLADFGLAMNINSLTKVDAIYGTMGYLAPEYALYGKVSEKIDVYGFGVTLLEILSGQHGYDIGRNGSQELSLQTLSTIQQIPEDILSRATLLEVLSGDRGRKIDGAGNWSSQKFGISQQIPEDSSTNQYIDNNLQNLIISSTSGLKNLDNLMDPRLDRKYPFEAANLAVQLVLSCVADDPNKRPSMEEVVEILEHIQTIKMSSTTSDRGQVISDPSDPLLCDINLVSRSMVYEPAPFDADAELSFSVPRSMMMSQPTPYDADVELPFSLSKSVFVYEPAAPFDAETELSFPKFKTSHSPISIEV